MNIIHTTSDYLATAREAVARSSSHNEIVSILCAREQHEHVRRAVTVVVCDEMGGDYDQVDHRTANGDPITEMWDSTHDDGNMDWRVHVISPARDE